MVELVPDVDPENTDETFARLKKADIRFFCDNDASKFPIVFSALNV